MIVLKGVLLYSYSTAMFFTPFIRGWLSSWGKPAEVSLFSPGEGLPPAPALEDGGIPRPGKGHRSPKQPLSAGAAPHAGGSSADVCWALTESKASQGHWHKFSLFLSLLQCTEKERKGDIMHLWKRN